MSLIKHQQITKSIKKELNQFLPECLFDDSLVKFIPYKEKKLKSSYLIDICHNLILKYYFKKENIFNLSSIILKEKYGQLYNYYINYLQEKGIICLVSNYYVGKNTRIYKINEKILNSKISRFRNSDKILLKKHNENNNIFRFPEIIENDIKEKLINDLYSVEIEYSKSIFFLESTSQDKDIYNRNKWSVECIKESQIFYHFDNYGRMHTNFTILKSFIRKNCLLIDGEPTKEIDIKNSQPLFLTKVIESNSNIPIDEQEYNMFKYLTLNGLFYQYLLDKTIGYDKKNIKELTYKVLFGKNHRNKSDNLFKSIFPSVHNFIKTYKRIKGDYRILSYELQRLESNLIYNSIIRDLMTYYPDIKIITIHDSIIYPERWEKEVKEIFNTKLENVFNS